MLIPNLPFGYKTRDWWAKAIKQIAESAASILPSRSSADAGKVLKVDSSGDLEWGTDEALPSGGNNGDVLTKTVTGPGWFPPAKELPVSTAVDAGKALVVDEDGEPEWGTEIASSEGGRVALTYQSDEENGHQASIELYHDEEEGFADKPSLYASAHDSNNDVSISMTTKRGPKMRIGISDGTDDYAPELSESPTVWTAKSLVTLEKVQEMISEIPASGGNYQRATASTLSGEYGILEVVT